MLLSHFAPRRWKPYLPAGSSGVDLFFVLSGFLISSILWRGRLGLQAHTTSAGRIWKQFLLRRTLRIFPIYYLTIAFAVVAGLGITLHDAKWFLSYLANVYFVRRGSMSPPTMPLWSLAVEEQFYLLWPAVLLFFPRSLLAVLLPAAVLFSPGYRIWAAQQGLWGREILLPACLAMFALGTVLAILSVERSPRKRAFERASLAIASILWLTAWLSTPASPALGKSLSQSATGFASLWLIGGADRGFGAPGRWILGSRPITYLGKISYGIYLYHLFVAVAVDKFLAAYGLPRIPNSFRGLLLSALTILCAAASWHFIEAPIGRLKDRIGKMPGSLRPTTRT